MDCGVDLHGIVLDECAAGLIVARRLYALHFAQQLAEELAQSLEVVDHDVALAILLDPLDDVVLLAVLVAPFGYELAVAHVRLLDILACLDTCELCHHAVHDV